MFIVSRISRPFRLHTHTIHTLKDLFDYINRHAPFWPNVIPHDITDKKEITKFQVSETIIIHWIPENTKPGRIQTPDGPKILLLSDTELKYHAKLVDENSICCLLEYPPGLIVEMIVDNLKEATKWLEIQEPNAMICAGQTGQIIKTNRPMYLWGYYI